MMNWYWNHNRYIYLDLIISGIITLSICLVSKQYGTTILINDSTYEALLGLSGALLGFLIASLTILVGFLKEDKISLLKEAGFDKVIIKIFSSSLEFLGLVLLWSFINLVVEVPACYAETMSLFTIFLLLSSGFRVQKASWILIQIIKIVIR